MGDVSMPTVCSTCNGSGEVICPLTWNSGHDCGEDVPCPNPDCVEGKVAQVGSIEHACMVGATQVCFIDGHTCGLVLVVPIGDNDE